MGLVGGASIVRVLLATVVHGKDGLDWSAGSAGQGILADGATHGVETVDSGALFVGEGQLLADYCLDIISYD